MPIPQGAVDVLTTEGASAAAEELSRAAELAVDVEADAMHAFRARLCFVQLATEERVYLFDTLASGVRVDVLAELFADPGRVKYFHAAGGDLQYLAEAGVRVKGLFDTHRAATLLGWPKVGLADLVLDRMQVKLEKAHQQSDFSIRPLPSDMRAYIADDVRYLVEIGRQVREECRRADILEEVELDCQRLADEAASRPEVGADFRPKLPRGSLSPKQLALAQALVAELHARRLRWAEAANVPMGRMLSNSAVLAIATRPPGSLKELQRTQGVRGGFVREHGDEVLELIRALMERSRNGELELEVDRSPRDPKRRKREEALKAFRAEKAQARGVTPSVVLPNALLEGLAARPPESLEELSRFPYFGDKRVRLYGAELLALLTSPLSPSRGC